jgi:hypothetical protein
MKETGRLIFLSPQYPESILKIVLIELYLVRRVNDGMGNKDH